MHRHHTAYQLRPVTAELPGDPYRSLVVAVLTRALSDALGRSAVRGDGLSPREQDAARTWLMGQGAAALLELAGYEAEAVLRQVRRVLDG